MTASARQPPSDAEVHAAWQNEHTRREHGAKLRAARHLGCSPSHVTNVLGRYAPPDDMAYVAPPGSEGYEEERRRICTELRARMAAAANGVLLEHLLSTPAVEAVPNDAPVMSTSSSIPFPDECSWKFGTFKALIPHDFRADAQLAADVTLLVAWDVTGLAIVCAVKCWWFGLLMFGVALWTWHVAARMQADGLI